MQLRRTDKGTTELRARQRVLTLRERAALFLLDRPRPLAEVAAQLGETAPAIVQALLAAGYIEVLRPEAAPGAAAPAPAEPAVAAAPAPDGRRSLAAARMFLFDLCERMLVRRDPVLAREFRDALREARDAQPMMDVAGAIIAYIDSVAGPERAAAVQDQLRAVLPEDLAPPETTQPAPLG